MQNLSHTSLGQYQLNAVIGRGRMSTVYKAYQPALHRFVAIKVFQQLDLLGAARFEQEAQLVARLHHPNILPIFDYGQQGELRYFVTQYIDNSATLSDLLVRERVPPLAALSLLRHLLAGLGYAHARGIIHRDIKPSNILLPAPSWPLLADFGIAKLVGDLRQLTPPGQRLGTLTYMAPELARGLPFDTRSDLYSAGVVLYELLTGRAPFDAHNPAALLHLHMHTPPPSPRSLNPALPLEVETVVLRALHKDPAARYQSADEMANDLERVSDDLERERTLIALLGTPAPAAAARATRSYAGSTQAVPRSTERLQAATARLDRNTTRRSKTRSNHVRAAWRGGPLFMAVIACSLLGGMLAAMLLGRYSPDDAPRPKQSSIQAPPSITPLAANHLPTAASVLPTTSSQDQSPLFSPAAPTVLEQPLSQQPSPIVPVSDVTSTSVPLDQPAPPLDPPLPPTLALLPEPSIVEPTPTPPDTAPTDMIAPSSVSE